MKEKTTQMFRKIGLIASYLPFAGISAFFLLLLDRGNRMFFSYSSPQSGITTTLLRQIVTVFSWAAILLLCVLTVLSFALRQKKRLNQGLIVGCGGFAALYTVFFLVMARLIGLYEISLKNLNLYALYFIVALLATAILLYSAIRNLIWIKKSPVTFAKQNLLQKPAQAKEPTDQPEDSAAL